MPALSAVRSAFASEGLHVVRPVGQGALDARGVALSLNQILPDGRTGLVIADGGGEFFARFSRSPGAGSDPLDRYTAQVIRGLLLDLFGADRQAFAVRFPFVSPEPPPGDPSPDARSGLSSSAFPAPLPIQRLALAAGLPPSGPLGLQIHPTYGPWWAYRAFVVVPEMYADEEPLPSPCPGCAAPCVSACLGSAVTLPGLDAQACANHRLIDPACGPSCVARLACPVGSVHHYPSEQLAFHMNASLIWLRRHWAPSRG